MAISSTTGFARCAGGTGAETWAWELKSVNGRGLDVRFRVPPGYDSLEPSARKMLTARLQRGQVAAALQFQRAARDGVLKVNEEALAIVRRAAEELAEAPGIEAARADGLLGLRGVLEISESEEDEDARRAREQAMLADFETALEALAQARLDEGEHLEAVVGEQVDAMGRLVDAAEQEASAQPEALRQRLIERLDGLVGERKEIDPDRLAQEVAILASKADIREELDRLRGHLNAVRDLLGAGEACGRRLDFLAQELNREANTLCAKSSDATLTNLGLEMKTVIDQFREQVQNIE